MQYSFAEIYLFAENFKPTLRVLNCLTRCRTLAQARTFSRLRNLLEVKIIPQMDLTPAWIQRLVGIIIKLKFSRLPMAIMKNFELIEITESDNEDSFSRCAVWLKLNARTIDTTRSVLYRKLMTGQRQIVDYPANKNIYYM